MIVDVAFAEPVCRRFEHVSNFPEGEPRPVCRVMAKDVEEAKTIASRRHPSGTVVDATVVEELEVTIERIPIAPVAGDPIFAFHETVFPIATVERVVGWIWPLGHPEPDYFEVVIDTGATVRVVRLRGSESRAWTIERRKP